MPEDVLYGISHFGAVEDGSEWRFLFQSRLFGLNDLFQTMKQGRDRLLHLFDFHVGCRNGYSAGHLHLLHPQFQGALVVSLKRIEGNAQGGGWRNVRQGDVDRRPQTGEGGKGDGVVEDGFRYAVHDADHQWTWWKHHEAHTQEGETTDHVGNNCELQPCRRV